MIQNLKFKITFATGKTFEGNHDFQTGLSSITGANEKGKSLRLEMIRYCLFGGEALRAEAKNYTLIDAQMTFVVAGKTYVVHRRNKKADLTADGKPAATGTSPVNTAILKILGYDLEVFDVANACLQGEIEAMTNKRPAERKQMVDRTIGLDAVDHVLDNVAQDISATRKAIEILNEKVIQIYEEPMPPTDVQPTDSIEGLEKALEVLERLNQRKSYLDGLLDNARCTEPEEFDVLAYNKDSATLDELQDSLSQLAATYDSLEGNKAALSSWNLAVKALDGKDVNLIKKFISEGYDEKWLQYGRYEQARVSEPKYTQADIDLVREGNEKTREKERLKLVECPSCHHEFDLYGKEKVVYDFAPYEEAKKRVNATDEQTLRSFEKYLDMWNTFKQMEPVSEPDLGKEHNCPGLLSFIELMTSMRNQGFDAELVKKRIDAAEQDYTAKKERLRQRIADKKEQERLKAEWQKQSTAWDNFCKLQKEHEPEYRRLVGVDVEIASVKKRLTSLKLYEEAVTKYQARQQAQSDALQNRSELELNIELLGRVRKSLNELKPKVKMHLLPSLNSVASTLLAQMTNGQRNKIVVDENFEIAVDDQPVKTLSGSGKAVANLAVRIALGMVLTNKIFSVFLADEIDAAMDDERAEYTAQCLRNLTSTISQVILVSHKEPDADHQIIL